MKYTIALVSLALSGTLFAGTANDWNDEFNKLLKTYVVQVTKGGVVHTSVKYDAMRKAGATAPLRRSLARVSDAKKLGVNDELSFWINAYNFLAIDTVVRNPKIKKLTDLNKMFKKVWKQTAGSVAGKAYSLDDIEHGFLRKYFDEPRMHVALVCAAKSCPNIRWEAYRGSKLDGQLDDQLKTFVASPDKGVKIDASRRTIHISPIFKWFKEDFAGGPVAWLKGKGLITAAQARYTVKYLDYDWTLNKK
jgi:hypothetical protein